MVSRLNSSWGLGRAGKGHTEEEAFPELEEVEEGKVGFGAEEEGQGFCRLVACAPVCSEGELVS
jgi:hypothetical protein